MAVERLEVLTGPAAGHWVEVERELVVGRDEAGPGRLGGDAEISRRHARLRSSGSGHLEIEDLGSTNGTFVDGQRITAPRLLTPGTEIRLGSTTLRWTVASSARETVQLTAPQRHVPVSTPDASPVPARTATAPSAKAGWGRRAVAWVAALAVVAAALVGGYALGRHGEQKAVAPVEAAPDPDVLGTVYIESNVAQPNGNAILAYRYRRGGDLHPLQISTYPTGGAGSGDLTDSGALDADQHLLYSPEKKLLFAVNQGSDTIAVFKVAGDGGLTPVKGSPFASGGAAPASVGLSGDTLVVVNKAQDGIRALRKVAPNYTTFTVRPDGSLAPIGSTVEAPPGSSPTQALISTSGHVVISTEESGPLRAFALTADGVLTQGPNSPQDPPDSIFPAGFAPKLRFALGLGVHPKAKVLYAQMATINKMAVYRYDERGTLTFVKVVPNDGGDLPCWTLLNKDGSRLYTDNAGNNTMTVYDTTDPMSPRQLQVLHLKHKGNPWDVALDPSGTYIFMVDPRARENVGPGEGQEVHSLTVAPDGTLSEPTSPAPIPVELGVNPIGIAVVANSGGQAAG